MKKLVPLNREKPKHIGFFLKNDLSVMLVGKNWYSERNCELVFLVNCKEEIINRVDYTNPKETSYLQNCLEEEFGVEKSGISGKKIADYLCETFHSMIA